ncbi:ATP-binding protein [Skermanella rosea]|uniref:sensor histidine kinase n=1 Tax=Skermanella rosea TaxID=1817965 RepID=UPI00193429F6|nr:ATP-binding protein [Skermanella rosea]UEM01898.1 ATP-binding protein [Skermanella rosea]
MRHDRDIVHARQRARLVADRMGFEVQDQTRIATAVSEVCRNAYAYATGGKAEFRIQEVAGKVALVIEVGDRGPGISELDDILAGRYRSRTGMGLGLLGARRLMDKLDIETSGDGTTVRLTRILSKPLGMAIPEFINKLMDELARQQPLDPVEEVQRQNQELLSSLNDLRQREEELLEANAALRASVVEKEVLLKEVYHRVKNNLQIISSLVSLKARKSTNPLVRQELDDVRSRIHSLSIVHEKLYQSDDLARVDLSGYVRDLCAHLRTSFTARGDGPELMVETDNVALGLDMAIQLGLLINEIVTNAFKHAFPDGARGEIRVSLTVLPGERLRLEVTDNGKGMPEEATDSLGMNLIRALATRVEGVLEIEGANGDGGTRVTVTMPLHGD